MKYYWNEETIEAFKFESNYLNKKEILQSVTDFVIIECEILENETEEDLIKDLMKNIYNN